MTADEDKQGAPTPALPLPSNVMALPSADRAEKLRIVEALLFAAPEPLKVADVARHFAEGEDVTALLEELQGLYAGRGVNLMRVAGKWAFRTADDLEKIVRENISTGVNKFFVTDDNLARNKNWEDLFDRLIHLRETEDIRVKMTIQVDTLCHRIPNFIEKAAKAGVHHVFIGLENINPDNLLAAKKRQNKITE